MELRPAAERLCRDHAEHLDRGVVDLTGTVGGGATLSLSKNFQWDFEVSKVVGTGRNAWAEELRFRWMLF